MRQLKFSAAEFDKLSEAEANSNELSKLEIAAMNTAKGQFDNSSGSFTIIAAPDRQAASRILFDDRYHVAKANTMRPIQEFLDLLEARTEAELLAVKGQHKTIITSTIGRQFSGPVS